MKTIITIIIIWLVLITTNMINQFYEFNFKNYVFTIIKWELPRNIIPNNGNIILKINFNWIKKFIK